MVSVKRREAEDESSDISSCTQSDSSGRSNPEYADAQIPEQEQVAGFDREVEKESKGIGEAIDEAFDESKVILEEANPGSFKEELHAMRRVELSRQLKATPASHAQYYLRTQTDWKFQRTFPGYTR